MTFNSFLTYETDSADIDEVKLTAKFFPRNTKFQDVLSIELTSKPSAGIKRTEDEIVCKWDKPSTEMSFNINSLVKSKNDFVKVIDKISFPPPSFSNELKRYTQPSKNVDLTSEIKTTANELVEGETDYLIAITRIADFTKKHIKYELNIKTEEGVKPASWVYENKQGACDEISSSI